MHSVRAPAVLSARDVASRLAWCRVLLRRVLQWLLLCAALVGPTSVALASGAPRIAEVHLGADAPLRVIAGQVQVLEDPLGTLDDVRALQQHEGWRTLAEDAIRLGPSRSDFWLRVRLINSGQDGGTFVLALGAIRQDHVRWRVLDPQGRLEFERDTGDRLPRESRPIDSPAMALPLQLAAGDWRDVYVRIRAHDGLIEPMPVQVSGEQAFHRQERAHLALLALYSGALLSLLLYNFVLYASTRRVEFAAYVTYGVGLLLWNLAYFGVGFEWFWRDEPVLNHQLPLVGGAIAHAGAWWFVPAYLRLHERADLRGTVRAYHLAALGHLACGALALTDRYTLATFGAFAIGLPMLLYTPWLSWRLARQGQREGVFLGVATAAPVLALVVFYVQLFGWATYSPWGQYSIQLGSFVEMCLLALGLADSMNTLKAQKLAAEQQALAAQRALSSSLEQQVGERTLALEHANRRLGQLAVTDELTGAFNRRRFNEVLGAATAAQASRCAWALAMFDLDHFKRYNDHYGHLAGDQVLRRVAQAVGTALGSRGELFRLGGEEFAVLFASDGPDEAAALAQVLCEAIRALAIPHAASPIGRVSASFGVQHTDAAAAASSADAVYAAADAALYAAKSQGRDRVVLLTASAAAATASTDHDSGTPAPRTEHGRPGPAGRMPAAALPGGSRAAA
ncbi:MAG: sensor domain-containing diguanylate cyclase [Burkholderiaceae bacterium]|nr:sensor domain-containing diguanylate cyclase [Burkholderiaceae bacterium]